jgi:hypothetical protein
MKLTVTLHPLSLAVGAAALGGVLWLVSAVQAPASHASPGQVPVTLGAPIEVKGIPVVAARAIKATRSSANLVHLRGA